MEFSKVHDLTFSFKQVFKHLPRAGRRDGGIALLFRDELKLTVNSLPTYESFETMMCTLTVVSTSVDIVVIYRPPNTCFNKFMEDFSLMLDELIFRPIPLLITGDLNIHLDNPALPNTKKFHELIASYGLLQKVSSPTHEKGHILDVLIIRNLEGHQYSNIQVIPGLSDHSGAVSST